MKNLKISAAIIVLMGLFFACSSTKEKVGETSANNDNHKPTDSIQIRRTTNGNMSNTYPSN